MNSILFCTVLNAILDPIFIKILGFKGAAIATVLSQVLCLVFVLLYLWKKKLFSFQITYFSSQVFGEIAKKVVPSAFQQSLPAVSTAFLTTLISSAGISAIAAYGVAGKLEVILLYPAMAMNMVLTNIVGRCAGAGEARRAKEYLRYGLKLGTGLLVLLSAGVMIFVKPLSGLFLSSDGVKEIVAGYFMIVSIGYILNMITNCFLGTINGLGYPGKSLKLMSFYYLVVRMPLAWLFLFMGYGLTGIWGAVLLSHIAACIATVLTGRRQSVKAEPGRNSQKNNIEIK